MTALREPLPIDDALPALRAALAEHRYAVLVAPPGAGKTTEVPLALLDAPWRGDGKIIVLEPRRLAARGAARRMAQRLGSEVGGIVGHRLRFDVKIGSKTRIEVVTEGVFTRMILGDPELNGVAAVLFDEFHERSLEGDLGLALAIDAAALREDLRILVMSATLDGAAVAKLLDDAPVVESHGRAHPVETRHIDRDPLTKLEDQIASVVLEALRRDPGSVLVFVPGQAEIRRVAERLETRLPQGVDLAPLFGQLTPAEQDFAVLPATAGRRKVVLATSIAETSLTIEGVRIVVDAGLARGPEYDPATGMSVLTTKPVSRASADQRRGRAGRTEPGICYRLWREAQTLALQPYDVPEILAADLAGFALDLASWGVADPTQLRFLDPPPKAAWAEAVKLLQSLAAVDGDGRITAHGAALSRLPLHPRLAHMVAAAAADGDARTAAELALIVSERGLGGDGVDLAERLDRFRTTRGERADSARTMARRWAELAGGKTAAHAFSPGYHLARAYPDRVAQASGATGRFRLANGRAASLEPGEALARVPFLVVTEVTGSASNGRIRGAAAIDRQEIETLYGDRIAGETTLTFDRAAMSVRARRVKRLESLLLGDEPAPVDDLDAAATILAAGVAEVGVEKLGWSKDQRTLRARATYLSQTLGAPWPDLSDAALAKGGAAWLIPHVRGVLQIAGVTADHLDAALQSLLAWKLRSELDVLLPSHFSAPSGSNIPIDYDAENGPALSIRVQELFGLDRHPAIAGGKIPLLVILLSPAHRPIQVTRDLPGFWRGTWKDVAKDLKGRYPRHVWPEDPLTTAATSRAKPRGS